MRKILEIITIDYLMKLGYVDKYYNWREKSPVDDWVKYTKLSSIADIAESIKDEILEWEEEL